MPMLELMSMKVVEDELQEVALAVVVQEDVELQEVQLHLLV